MASGIGKISAHKMTREIMTKSPVPIIIVGENSLSNKKDSFKAYQSGAMDYFQLPFPATSINIEKTLPALEEKITLVSRVKVIKHVDAKADVYNIQARDLKQSENRKEGHIRARRLVLIGVSTGGVPVIRTILNTLLPGFDAAIVIVQHMPHAFIENYAELLNKQTPVAVRNIKSREPLLSNMVYIAAEKKHLVLNSDYTAEYVEPDPGYKGYVPSIDILFSSAARLSGKKAAVILTGIGNDGTSGALQLKKAGVPIIVQKRTTCAVSGMPESIIKANAADFELEPEKIAAKIEELLT
jgi:two-component system chemotaxis response regulator CheB